LAVSINKDENYTEIGVDGIQLHLRKKSNIRKGFRQHAGIMIRSADCNDKKVLEI